MVLVIKNRLFTLKGGSRVKDELGNDAYKVDGKFFTITRKKYVRTLDDKTLYTVRNKFWHILFRSAYLIDSNGKKVMKIKRKFAIKSKFNIFTKDGNTYSIDGNFIGWNWQIKRNDEIIASIYRKIDWNDSFVLDVVKEEDKELCLAMVIGIDNIIDAERNERS